MVAWSRERERVNRTRIRSLRSSSTYFLIRATCARIRLSSSFRLRTWAIYSPATQAAISLKPTDELKKRVDWSCLRSLAFSGISPFSMSTTCVTPLWLVAGDFVYTLKLAYWETSFSCEMFLTKAHYSYMGSTIISHGPYV